MAAHAGTQRGLSRRLLVGAGFTLRWRSVQYPTPDSDPVGRRVGGRAPKAVGNAPTATTAGVAVLTPTGGRRWLTFISSVDGTSAEGREVAHEHRRADKPPRAPPNRSGPQVFRTKHEDTLGPRTRVFTPTRVVALALITVLIADLVYMRFAPGAGPVTVPEGASAGELILEPCRVRRRGRQLCSRLRNAGCARDPGRSGVEADRVAGDADPRQV